MINIGIICPSDIAWRRFMPALAELDDYRFVGVAYALKSEWPDADELTLQKEREKAEKFVEAYGGNLYEGYSNIIHESALDAIYIPLPPALHFHWANMALDAGKHVLVEKPATTSHQDTERLIKNALSRGLALHENYMFIFHEQIKAIDEIIRSGVIGGIRLYRLSFGFPRRALNDFRYNKSLGGGALLDAGGYTLKYASILLGSSTRLLYANAQFVEDFEVDAGGSAALVNDEGICAQVAFGMDHSYKCDLEVWGSKGTLFTGRIFTAPAGFTPEVTLTYNNTIETKKLPEDNAFRKSLIHFKECIISNEKNKANLNAIKFQAKLVQEFQEIAKLI